MTIRMITTAMIAATTTATQTLDLFVVRFGIPVRYPTGPAGKRGTATGRRTMAARPSAARIPNPHLSAVLTSAVLTSAVLTSAVLTSAALTSAVLTSAALTSAALTSAALSSPALGPGRWAIPRRRRRVRFR